MKRIVFLMMVICLAAMVIAQEAPKPTVAPNPAAAPAVVPVVASSQVQSQVDAAWKDLQIAQLKLQLVVEQAVNTMEKGTYYDYSQQKFLRRVDAEKQPEKATAKATPPAPKK